MDCSSEGTCVYFVHKVHIQVHVHVGPSHAQTIVHTSRRLSLPNEAIWQDSGMSLLMIFLMIIFTPVLFCDGFFFKSTHMDGAPRGE